MPALNNLIPQAVEVWPDSDGKKHDRYEDAVASNIAKLLGGDKSEASVTPAIAKQIVGHRSEIIELLSSVPAFEEV